MLVLSRLVDEQVVIDGDIIVTVVEIRGDKVRLGFKAPKEIVIDRSEVHVAKQLGVERAPKRDTAPPVV